MTNQLMTTQYQTYSIDIDLVTPKIILYEKNIKVGTFIYHETIDTFFFLGSPTFKYKIRYHEKATCTQITGDQ